MYRFTSFSPAALALVALLALAACDSAEERAEEHFQSGLTLLESGDVDRAVVEFRNAFKLDPAHIESRRSLARLMLEERNDKRRAYRQYLWIAEQSPEDLEARIALSEIAFVLGNWDEVTRHAEQAESLAPEDPRVRAIGLARLYRSNGIAEDSSAMRDVARQAEDMLTTQPDNPVLRALRIDAALRENDFSKALDDIDWMLERDPSNVQLLNQRLGVLVQLGDTDAVEAQLRDMIARSPDDASQKTALLRFFLSNGEPDKAEDYLRELAAVSEDTQPKIDLVNFIRQTQGREAADTQLDQFIAENDDQIIFQLLKAAIAFDNGDQQDAMTRLETALRDAPEGATETLNAKVALARMQLATGNEVGARARVAEVLASNPSHPEALKIQAAWRVDADETELAIADLRTVLDQEPEDAQAMTLMAQTYERSGQSALAQDFLALAVEASGNAPAETIRYARLMMGQENYRSAEDLLLAALRLAPQNINLIVLLGELYIATDDFGRLDQVISTLRGFDTPQTDAAANGFEAARINRQSGMTEAVQFLESLSLNTEASLTAQLTLIRARLESGDVDRALTEIRALEAENPDNPSVALFRAATESAAGNFDTAETIFRNVVTDTPQIGSEPWLQLARLQTRQANADAGEAIIDEALTHLPEDGNLLWAKASYLESKNDIDGAIRIYETLYARNSGSIVVANNLASLLSTYRQDEESLERAWVVARRFRDTDIPQMQDTYGWILYRRGNVEDALPYLEDAASSLTSDPIVQYHLGQSYLALERTADAIAQFQKVDELANPADPRAQIVDARAKLESLDVPEEIESK